MPARPRTRVAVISRLYPRPHLPHYAPFNKQYFERLAKRFALDLLVPIPFPEWYRHRDSLVPGTDEGMSVRYTPWVFPPKLGRTLYPSCFALCLLPYLRWLEESRPACLIVSWAYPDAVGALMLAHKLGIPVVVKTYGSDVNVHAKHPLRAAQMRWALNRASGTLCVSQALRQTLEAIGVTSSKLFIVPTGIDPGLFYPAHRASSGDADGGARERRCILFIGNLLREKGVRELLAAFERIAAARASVDLIYLGDGPERSWLERQLAPNGLRGGLRERVRVVGRIPHAEVGDWLRRAELLCLPSYREGLPNVVLEAMACGVPVVATAVGGIPEAVSEDVGILVPPRLTTALAEALAEALDRTWAPETIAARASRYSWDATIDATSRVIERAIASGAS